MPAEAEELFSSLVGLRERCSTIAIALSAVYPYGYNSSELDHLVLRNLSKVVGCRMCWTMGKQARSEPGGYMYCVVYSYQQNRYNHFYLQQTVSVFKARKLCLTVLYRFLNPNVPGKAIDICQLCKLCMTAWFTSPSTKLCADRLQFPRGKSKTVALHHALSL